MRFNICKLQSENQVNRTLFGKHKNKACKIKNSPQNIKSIQIYFVFRNLPIYWFTFAMKLKVEICEFLLGLIFF